MQKMTDLIIVKIKHDIFAFDLCSDLVPELFGSC
jgi:hypothetical protein